jgi:hypothetical protein
MTEVYVMLLADVTILFVCACLLVLFGRLAHSHPATLYLLFHAYTVTFRLVGLTLDTRTTFTKFINYGYYLPVTESELIRAAIVADVALMVMTMAWIKASVDAQRSTARRQKPIFRRLSLNYIIAVVLVAFPIGILGIVLFANLPTIEGARVNLGQWETSSWPIIIVSWSGLVFLALMYWYGFRWWLTLSMTLYLLLMSYQGFHRFRVVIPLIFMMQIYLDRHRLRWPSMRFVTMLVLLALLFFPLKHIGNEMQTALSPDNRQEVSFRAILNNSIENTRGALAGENDDQQFLDQFASALTLIDDAGRFYYGTTYLPLVTMPIPKQWWPEKPGLADYMADFSTPWRPMKEMGMVITFWGEAYLNFGYIGILIIPGLFAYGLGRFYFYAYEGDYFTVARFAYLLVACILIQVFRDGLMSLVIFPVVNMMPLTAIVLLHYGIPLFFGNPHGSEASVEVNYRTLPRQASA